MKNFSITAGYKFAKAHNLGKEAQRIHATKILKWSRSYETTVRKGMLADLIISKGLGDEFKKSIFPELESSVADRKIDWVRDIRRQYDAYLGAKPEGAAPISPDALQLSTSSETTDQNPLKFALEAHLRDFLARNLSLLEPGLVLYENDDRTGIEFPVSNGRIDILAVDQTKNFVVIELKLSEGRNKTLGQLLYYMGWVDKNLGRGACRGIIVANEITNDLVTAVRRTIGVTLAKYSMQFSVEVLQGE